MTQIWIVRSKSEADQAFGIIFELSDPKKTYDDILFNFRDKFKLTPQQRKSRIRGPNRGRIKQRLTPISICFLIYFDLKFQSWCLLRKRENFFSLEETRPQFLKVTVRCNKRRSRETNLWNTLYTRAIHALYFNGIEFNFPRPTFSKVSF